MRFSAISLLAVPLMAACASAPDAVDSRRMVVVARDEARFVPVVARLPDGPQMAVLWGDPSSGPSAMLLEMKQGPTPLHVHTADYHLVIIEGELKHWGEGETEATAKTLGPGGYWFQPGNEIHGDACLTPTCLVQVVWSGPRDGRLAE